MLTDLEMETLRKLDASEEKEIVCDGASCYIDEDSVPHRHVIALLRTLAISDTSDEGGGLRRYSLNSTGRSILFNPEIQHQIMAALLQSGGGAFTIENNTVKPI